MTAPADLPALAARIRELSAKATSLASLELAELLHDHALTIADALERCGKMEKALEFYSRPHHWESGVDDEDGTFTLSPAVEDAGEIARQAVAALTKDEEKQAADLVGLAELAKTLRNLASGSDIRIFPKWREQIGAAADVVEAVGPVREVVRGVIDDQYATAKSRIAARAALAVKP